MSRLTAAQVRTALAESRATNPDGANNIRVKAMGLACTFNAALLEARRGEIQSMIEELHPKFRKGGGGGWSFLNLPLDKYGNQWGEQPDALGLLLMAKGLGLGYTLDDMMPGMMPGGVPYVVFE